MKLIKSKKLSGMFEGYVEEKYKEKELVYIPYEPKVEYTDEDIVFYIF